MRVDEVSKLDLFESTLLTEDLVVLNEWKSVGKIINEANLTIDQINQLFTIIADPNAAGGGYRVKNTLGKAVSGAGAAAGAVGRAYQGLLDKVSNLGPIKYFDDKMDQVFTTVFVKFTQKEN